MRLAIIIQRYGLDINGGAELHARWIAEHLNESHHVTVLTTCALDYLYWRNHYSPGKTFINSVPVIRFKVKKPRRGRTFIAIQNKVFYEEHTEQDELRWIHENGPYSPSLIRYIKQHKSDYDFFIFFSYRYYTTYYGLSVNPHRSLLVPTAEEDPVIDLEIYHRFFNLPAGIIYNSIEERKMINEKTENHDIPGKVVGVGINTLPGDATRFNKKFNITRPYILYVGRIDKNKGCDKLIDYALRYFEREDDQFDLVLIGGQYMNVPDHPRILTTGFVSEQDKFDAIQGALFMVIPSHLESLCMALLECWAFKKAALVNGRCKVLKGQVIRANGGLFFRDYSEFHETLKRLLRDEALRTGAGRQGFQYFQTHYRWSVIIEKYEAILNFVNSTIG